MPFVQALYENGTDYWESYPDSDWLDGRRAWLVNALHHRTDGPAIEYPDGKKEWCLFGIRYDPIEWLLKLYELGLK